MKVKGFVKYNGTVIAHGYPRAINGYLRNNIENVCMGTAWRTRVECDDGFSMSVQASRGHHSTPRAIALSYSEVEVGYPSEAEDILLPWIDTDHLPPTEAVYIYVPVEIIDCIIDRHGGLTDPQSSPPTPRKSYSKKMFCPGIHMPFKGQWYYEWQIGPIVFTWRHDGKTPHSHHIGPFVIWRDSQWKRHMLRYRGSVLHDVVNKIKGAS